MSNLANWVERHADFTPQKTALYFADTALSYAEFAEHIRAVARMLKHTLHISRGDRVAYLGFNSPDFLALVFATARLGAVLVPLNWRLAPPEHSYILSNAGVSAVITEPEFRKTLDPIRAMPIHKNCQFVLQGAKQEGWHSFAELLESAAGDDAEQNISYDQRHLIVYTSGTTGRPKGAVLKQEALLWNCINSLHMHDMQSEDRVLCALPMFHVGGLNIQTLPALYCGASVYLQRRFDPGLTLNAIARHKPTLTVLVPTTLRALLHHPDWQKTDLSSLRCITTGSSIVPLNLITAFNRRGVPVIQVYGSTETAPIAIYLRREDAERKSGSTGKPGLHCEIRIVDESTEDVAQGVAGEILVRGPNVMSEYWRDPQATGEALQDGWFRSGDIGHKDHEGFYYIDDRKKDVVVSGGENIYPAELEMLLQEIDAISDAVVIGRPDEQWGEVPVAVIELKPDAALQPAAVRAVFKNRLASYKHPRDVLFVKELPRNAMGKVQKFKVRELLNSGAY